MPEFEDNVGWASDEWKGGDTVTIAGEAHVDAVELQRIAVAAPISDDTTAHGDEWSARGGYAAATATAEIQDSHTDTHEGARSDGAVPSAGASAPSTPSASISRSVNSSVIKGSAALGMLLTLLSTFAFSVMALMVSLSAAANLSAFQLTSVRFFIQAACSVASVLWFRRHNLKNLNTWLGRPKNRRLLVTRAAWGALGMSSYFYALSYPGARLADVTTLVFINVPITAILARIILKEPYTKYDALTGLLCMVGVVLVAQPPAIFGTHDAASQPTPWPVVVVSLFGAVTSSFAYITIRQIGKGEDTLVMVLYFSVIGSIVGPLSSLAFAQEWVMPPTAGVWVMFFGVGVTGYVGQFLLNRGVQTAPAGPATVMRYADVIFAIIFQATIFSETPNGLKWVGCLLVMSCMIGVYVKYRRQSSANQKLADAAAAELATHTTAPPSELHPAP